MSTNTATIATIDATPKNLGNLIRTVCLSGKVPFVLGPPGIGKSNIMEQVARAAKRTLHDIRLAYYSPTDVSGMPYLDRETNRMRFAPMGLFPDEPGHMIFLDEFPLAPRATQNTALQLVLDGRVGEYALPKDTWICMAGNRTEDRCFGDRLSPAMVNRVVIIRLKPDLESWVEWAQGSGINPLIIAYVNFNPAALHSFNPTTWDGEGNFASPRSWQATDRLMKVDDFHGLDRENRRILVNGNLGTGVGSEFSGFLEVYQNLPPIESILKDPAKAKVPEKMDVRVATVAMCLNHASPNGKVDEARISKLSDYLGRFDMMFQGFFYKGLVRSNPKMISTKAVSKWVTDHPDVFA